MYKNNIETKFTIKYVKVVFSFMGAVKLQNFKENPKNKHCLSNEFGKSFSLIETSFYRTLIIRPKIGVASCKFVTS